MSDTAIPAALIPDAKSTGIVFHWTAGHNKASDLDRSYYHLFMESDGKHVRGVPSIDLNSLPKAAHRFNCRRYEPFEMSRQKYIVAKRPPAL